MTNEEINKAIAEKVMDKCWHDYMWTTPECPVASCSVNYYECTICGDEVHGQSMNPGSGSDYCFDISAAWQVVEKMREKGFMYDLFDCYEDTETHGCTFLVPVEPEIDDIVACEHAPTAPMAICLAALKAVS